MKKLLIIFLLLSLKSQAQKKKDIKLYVARESFLEPGGTDTTHEAYITFVKNGRHTRAFHVELRNDTAYVMPTFVDSLFRRARVIKVAGKTFVAQ